MDYREAWSYLDDLQFFKIKLGLDSMSAFLESVGQPQERLKFIHVAGTNGKGSVSANLLTILARAGYKVGLYTSPHLSSVRERFRINDAYISEEEFAVQATSIRNSLAGRQITYFEFTTALAMLWFAERQVDIVILEVGLGGRLDATNVVTPLLSIITNVSMDHEAHLGNTLTEVAFEKAGIIKPGVAVVSGVAADESLEVVEKTCLERGAPLYLFGRDFQQKTTSAALWSFVGSPGGRTITG
ncbi:MAG: bifunctional folylpolyglutamate synthase/dihydrofolate synthase, partial [Desulfobulbaceae bacterium]|nr:bifunctional folylpolyglutamate synthase/dihydrofolate synthase [Desulfobulbaceae bacterium]